MNGGVLKLENDIIRHNDALRRRPFIFSRG
jgi:hypothetical protein